MTNVIKRGGKTQKFSPSKIKSAVMGALREAKVPKPKRAKIVREVTGPVIKACKKKKTVKALAIRSLIVARLRKKSKEGAAAWIKYEKKHRKGAKRRIAKKRVVHHKRKRRR
jgi:transcriptional regulator NrdR family protein